MLELIDKQVRKDNGGNWVGLYRCHCGQTCEVRNTRVKPGGTVSCGCAWKKSVGFGEKLFKRWRSMHDRCENVDSRNYKKYGGRGIKVCDEWQEFKPFGEWARANGYDDSLAIDRIDNDGNYEPSNCRWVSLAENNRNRRTVKINMSIAKLMRKLSQAGVQGKELAAMWGIAQGTVSVVLNGHNWLEPVP